MEHCVLLRVVTVYAIIETYISAFKTQGPRNQLLPQHLTSFAVRLLARDVIYTYRAYATISVSVCLSVTEVHKRIIANLGFKFRSNFTALCGRGEGSSQQQHLALCLPLLDRLVYSCKRRSFCAKRVINLGLGSELGLVVGTRRPKCLQRPFSRCIKHPPL